MMKNQIMINQALVTQTNQFLKKLVEQLIHQEGDSHDEKVTANIDVMTGMYLTKFIEFRKSETELIKTIGDTLEELQSFLERAANDINDVDRKYADKKITGGE